MNLFKMATFSLIFLIYFSFCSQQIEGRYPCLNEGEPVLLGQNGNEFRCECSAGFFGPFCEYQDTSQTTKSKISPSSSSSTVNSSFSSRGWETTFVNLLLCIFFLLLLPSIVVYAVRVLYLFLKRCNAASGYRQSIASLANSRAQNQQQPTPPSYWAAIAEDGGQNQNNCFRQWTPINVQQRRVQNSSLNVYRGTERRRRQSESPVTEVTVQLPASFCRPLHGTHSAGPLHHLHQTQSLTLNEFHEFLLNIQKEMLAQQQMDNARERDLAPLPPLVPPSNAQRRELLLSPSHPPPLPPSLLDEPPPNYELALISTSPLIR